ncbi:MAG: SlyX [Planctomycetota bacterium]|jgi:uncharacterized coiled-coil protein SlyX
MNDRIVALESKIAILEHVVDALSGELAAQQRTVEQLQKHVELLLQQQRKSRGGEPIEPHDTPPPHWGGAS